MARTRTIAAAGLATLVLSAPALAETQVYFDRPEWEAAAGDYATLDFTGFEHGEILGDQYGDLGATFPDGNENIWENSSFDNDGWGARDIFFDGINMVLDEPRYTIATYFVGIVRVDLYMGDTLVYDSPAWGVGHYFIGFESDVAFDRVFIFDSSDGAVFVDDIFFGPPIPAPGPLLIAPVACIAFGRRRRAD